MLALEHILQMMLPLKQYFALQPNTPVGLLK